MPARAMPEPVSSMPATASRRAPQRSASGPLSTPRPKYRNPASENTRETEPREAANSCCNGAMKALNVYALPKPRNMIEKAAATTHQPWKRRAKDKRIEVMQSLSASHIIDVSCYDELWKTTPISRASPT
jgi:hypothetical protein